MTGGGYGFVAEISRICNGVERSGGARQRDSAVFRVTIRYDQLSGVHTETDNGWRLAGYFTALPTEQRSTLHELEALLANADCAVSDISWHNVKIGGHTRSGFDLEWT